MLINAGKRTHTHMYTQAHTRTKICFFCKLQKDSILSFRNPEYLQFFMMSREMEIFCIQIELVCIMQIENRPKYVFVFAVHLMLHRTHSLVHL